MAYCDETDVARYCGPSETADIAGAIAYATEVVDNYTKDKHEPLDDLDVETVIGRDGAAYLPYTCRDYSAVYETSNGELITANSIFSPGKKSVIRFTGNPTPNLLKVGSEPWVLDRSWAGTRITVTGDFGPEETPAVVREATAIIASRWLVSIGQAGEGAALSAHAARESGVSSISVEGYAVSYTTGTETSTGIPTVDRMLAPFRRTVTRWA